MFVGNSPKLKSKYNQGILTLIVLATLCGNGIAQSDTTVFGLMLGKKLTVPECSLAKVRGGYYVYQAVGSKVCFERQNSRLSPKLSPVVSGIISVRFPTGQSPNLVKGTAISALVIDGMLEGVDLTTSGAIDDQRVMANLENKYGAPSKIQKQMSQPRAGVSIPRVTADWIFPDLLVHYESVVSTFDTGRVTVDTPKAAAHKQSSLNPYNFGPPM